MTQITVRKVDEELAEKIRESAKAANRSLNDEVLRLLKLHYGDEPTEEPIRRNDLHKYRKGWVEDPEFDAVMEELSTVHPDDDQ